VSHVLVKEIKYFNIICLDAALRRFLSEVQQKTDKNKAGSGKSAMILLF
jgi:hypothetical protein